MGDGLAVGRTPRRLGPRLLQVGEGLLPDLTLDCVVGEPFDVLG